MAEAKLTRSLLRPSGGFGISATALQATAVSDCIPLAPRRKVSDVVSSRVPGKRKRLVAPGVSVLSLPSGEAQDSCPGADAADMFRRLSEPLPLSEASLLSLRPALNAPVLNVAFLPVGPARAAIVVFAEEWGGIGLALGIRSNEGGQVAVFRNQESIEPDVSVTTALEPILSEAERMGFLFDEDMVAAATDDQGRTRALALWGRLMGELELGPVPSEPAASESVRLAAEASNPAPLPPARPNEPSTPAPQELVLEEWVPELDLSVEGVVVASGDATVLPPDVSQETQPMVEPDEPEVNALPPQASATEQFPPEQKLSKFRQVDEAAESVDETTGGNQLGRIPLVRVRRDGNGGKRLSTLARLLSSF